MAYDQLLSEGYIESVPYKGYFVSELNSMFSSASGKTGPEAAYPKEKDFPL